MNNPLSHALPRPVSPAVPRGRRRAAIAIAAMADILQWALFPVTVEGAVSPVELAIDGATAIVLLVVLGFHWRLAFAMALELVPGFDMFPTWTAAVLSLPAQPKDLARPAAPPPRATY